MVRRMFVGAAVIVGLLIIAGAAQAAPCTKGVNCYCDKVQGGSLNDPLLLFCEDFEAPTLRNDQGLGAGAPFYGPPYDSSGWGGGGCAVAFNSYWQRKYGSGSGGLIPQGQPTNGKGCVCTFPNCFQALWDAANRWGVNNFAHFGIFGDSDYSAELSSIRPPTNRVGGGAGSFDGANSLAYRLRAGNHADIVGAVSFPATLEIGYTTAMAYPNNSLASGIWGSGGTPAAWKHNEWGTVTSPNCGFDGLFAFYNQRGPQSGRPFAGFIGAFGPGCTGNRYSGSVTEQLAGQTTVIPDAILWHSPTNYDQARDWPEGTWGCVRGHAIVNPGANTIRMRTWFQGPGMTSERLIIDFTATLAGLDAIQGWREMKWNPYANTNQGMGYVASTQTTFRYEDNVHARRGLPVSCAQIGFGGSVTPPPADTTAPAAPAAPTIR